MEVEYELTEGFIKLKRAQWWWTKPKNKLQIKR